MMMINLPKALIGVGISTDPSTNLSKEGCAFNEQRAMNGCRQINQKARILP